MPPLCTTPNLRQCQPHKTIVQIAVMETMADRLRKARALAGYESGSDAARALRINLPTYLGHENGSRGFSRQAARYAGFYKVDLRWLLTGVGSPKGRSMEAEISALPPEKQAQLLDFIEFLKKTGS